MNEKKSLLAALLAAQAEIPQVAKDAVNPHFKSKYATLDSIWAAIRATVKKAELVVTNAVEGGEVVTTVAEVKSGESICSRFPLPQGLAPQQIGSAITYAKRYNLCALLQITTGDDDDGNAASVQTEPPKRPSETAPRVPIDFSVCPCGKAVGTKFSDMDTSTLEKVLASVGKAASLKEGHADAIRAILAERTAKAIKDI